MTVAPAGDLAREFRQTAALALPVMLARSGHIVLTTVDTMMTGLASAEDLAAYAIGTVPFMLVMLLGLGMLTGTIVLVAQAVGAGRPQDAGAVWQLSMLNAVALGLLGLVTLLDGAALVRLLGQPKALVEPGGGVVRMLAYGLPGLLLFQATSFFLEGIRKPAVGLAVMIGANLLNLPLNWLLIGGHWGLPAMGAEGAALATSIVRWLMALAMIAFVLTMAQRRAYGVTAPLTGLRARQRRFLALGLPVAAAQGLETAAFQVLIVFAGWLGIIQLGAFQIVLSLASLIYMATIGIATATSVRVGNAVGRRDGQAAERAGWVGLGAGIAAMICLGPLFLLWPTTIAGIYTSDPPVLLLAAAVLPLLAITNITDCSQGVLAGAVRGAADVRIPTLFYVLGFWGVQAPLAWTLAFPVGMGLHGLVVAIFAGCTVVAALLSWRFRHLARHGRLLPAPAPAPAT